MEDGWLHQEVAFDMQIYFFATVIYFFQTQYLQAFYPDLQGTVFSLYFYIQLEAELRTLTHFDFHFSSEISCFQLASTSWNQAPWR